MHRNQITNTNQPAQVVKLGDRIMRAYKEITSARAHDLYNDYSPQEVKLHARKTIGSDLKEMREARGLTVRELAKLSGLQHSHIIRIEQGKYNVTLDTLSMIVNALGGQIYLDFCDDGEEWDDEP